MAQGMLGKALQEINSDSIHVQSAGLSALTGEPADQIAQSLMSSQGIDITSHRAQQLDRELLQWADLILTMERSHTEAIESMEPTARGKVYRIGKWDDFDVPDPYGRPIQAFDQAARLIAIGMKQWLPRLVQ